MKSRKIKGEAVTILLVEDNLDHAEMVKRCFEDHQLTNKMYHVTDGEPALDYLYRRSDYGEPEKSPRPHVILLDLRLPKIDGLEVLKKIKNSDNLVKIPVVILTTSEAEQDVAKAYNEHANSYLVKPVDFAKFTQLMNDLDYYWLAWNHFPWPKGVS